MAEPLGKEQLDAFRRAISVARVAQTGVTLKHNEAAALLAHIEALEAEIAALREAVRNLGGDPDQAWYWTDAWQAKEREADEDLRAGRYVTTDDIDTLLDTD